jgi:integrative and conjugative element protein (TIGR02256 family)
VAFDQPELFVHREVIERLRGVTPRPWEVGGWLLGWWGQGERSVLVTHATPPLSFGTFFGVTISGRGHRPLFDEAWEATDGFVTFLGDWHTHPGGSTVPSERDRRAMTKLAEDDDFGTPCPIIAIVGHGRWPWSRIPPDVRFYVLLHSQPCGLEIHIVDDLPPVAKVVPDWRW